MSQKNAYPFDSIEDALDALTAGQPVIVTDDENRENEGDLIFPASKATLENVNMMIRYCRGLICIPTTEQHLKRLGLNPMVANNRESHGTAFTVSVDAAQGITTGISAADRLKTIQIMANESSTADQLVQPGHTFPLRARPGGVLERAGHTEAAVDLAALAGQPPIGVICEILNDDGSCSRLPELIEFKKRFNLKLISIAQLIEYRYKRECLVEKLISQPFDSKYGQFDLHIFRSKINGQLNYALSIGELGEDPTLVRVHSENILHDLFGSTAQSNKGRLDEALKTIAQKGKGVLVYMTHPCNGLNLPHIPQSNACVLETAKMDFRGYGLGAQILSQLGLKKIIVLSNSPRRHVALDGYGLEIVDHIQDES